MHFYTFWFLISSFSLSVTQLWIRAELCTWLQPSRVWMSSLWLKPASLESLKHLMAFSCSEWTKSTAIWIKIWCRCGAWDGLFFQCFLKMSLLSLLFLCRSWPILEVEAPSQRRDEQDWISFEAHLRACTSVGWNSSFIFVEHLKWGVRIKAGFLISEYWSCPSGRMGAFHCGVLGTC